MNPSKEQGNDFKTQHIWIPHSEGQIHGTNDGGKKSWRRLAAPVLAALVGIALFGWMFKFQFFGGYIHEVLAHWMILMTGLASVLTEFYKGLRKSQGKYVPYVVAAMCVFFACFQAWQDEHRSLVSLQDNYKNPEFSGEMNGIFVGSHEMGVRTIPIVFVTGILTNPHGPPSGLKNWKMGIINMQSKVTWGNPLPLSVKNQQGRAGHGMPPITFENGKYLPDQTLQPLPAGGSVVGWFWSTFTKADVDEAYRNHYRLIMEFEDTISGTRHSIESQPLESGIHVPW